MSCENHLAVPCMLKKLNKCHSLHTSTQKVTNNGMRTLRASNTPPLLRGCLPYLLTEARRRPSDVLMLGPHTRI